MVLQWPERLDWRHWADRFHRMQERHLVASDSVAIEAGFSSVDCFWRIDCDAIYGGLLAGGHAP